MSAIAFRPSTTDLPIFFEERHHALAARLTGEAPRFSDEGHGHEDAGARARAAVAALTRADLFPLLVPPEGSQSIDVRALCLAREMLGYTSPLADSIFAVQGLGSYPIVLAGDAEQKARILPRVARGESIGAFALTEPEAGSDVASMRTIAERHHHAFMLRGEKTFISNAGLATHYVVFARLDPADGHQGINAFLVEADTPGLVIEPVPMSVDHPIGRLRFDGCTIPEGALLGPEGTGFKLAMRTLDAFRVSVGAAACGMARRALDEAIARVKARRQFGKPLAEQQTVQGYLAEMATDLDAARLLVWRAAHKKDTGADRAGADVAMAKMFATEAAQRIIDRAVQLFGGLGVTLGTVVERLYREIRPLRIYEGTTEIQRLIIARELLRSE